jgi:hypothetical protein
LPLQATTMSAVASKVSPVRVFSTVICLRKSANKQLQVTKTRLKQTNHLFSLSSQRHLVTLCEVFTNLSTPYFLAVFCKYSQISPDPA